MGRSTFMTRVARASVRLRAEVPLAAIDALLLCTAMSLIMLARFDGVVPPERWAALLPFLPVAVVSSLAAGSVTGLYCQLWRHASVLEARRVVVAGAASTVLILAMAALLDPGVPRSVLVLGAIGACGLQGLVRFQSRLFAYRRRSTGTPQVKVLVVGAGWTGGSLVRDMLEHPASGARPVGVLDDDPRTHGRSLHGVRVLGPAWDLVEQVRATGAEQVVLAVADAPQELVALVSRLCLEAGVVLRVVPPRAELVGKEVTLKDVRDIRIDDLLGRTQVAIDLDGVRDVLRGRRVLITGAGGSIGSEIARQVAQLEPSQLLLLDHDETHLHDVAATVDGPVTLLLCDIRQRGLVHRLFALHRPEVVFHAAAHKHVPLLEDHPSEAVKTNVAGTTNLVDAAKLTGVRRFVFISTDKAVRPASVMGASKAIGEQIVLDAAEGRDQYCAVRFGNVLGSRGSVIPTFVRQIQAGGPVTVTDERMTRFFMSIPEAVQLVLQATAMARGGEVFMLEMGEPVRIMELAERMIQLSGRRVGTDVAIEVTGMRPGEKLAEQLSTPDEEPHGTDHPSIVRLVPTRLPREVLEHEVEQLCLSAENGFDASVRTSLFVVALRKARRRRTVQVDPLVRRRVVDVAELEGVDPAWTSRTP